MQFARKWHRWIMTVFAILLIYWVGSGLLMAIYDATDSTQVWAIEGGGPGVRLTDSAVQAPEIPAPSTLSRGIAAALAKATPMTIASVDLRMRNGAVRLQLAEASGERSTMRRYYADTGLPMSDTVADGDFNAPVPRNVSFRNYIKSWHRGNIAGFGGQVLGLLTGMALIVLTVTGMILYFKLWNSRRARGKPEFFWSAQDSIWRRLHRWSSIVAAVFVLNIAISGTVLAYGEIQLRLFLRYHVLWPPYPRPTPAPDVSGAALPPGPLAMLQKSYQATRAQYPGARITSITLVERQDGVPHGLVTLGGARPVTLAYNAATGAPVRDWATGGVQVGHGYFVDWHQVLKRIHRGDIIGSYSGRYIDMVAGAALAYLVISSLFMYADMYRRQRNLGRKDLFW